MCNFLAFRQHRLIWFGFLKKWLFREELFIYIALIASTKVQVSFFTVYFSMLTLGRVSFFIVLLSLFLKVFKEQKSFSKCIRCMLLKLTNLISHVSYFKCIEHESEMFMLKLLCSFSSHIYLHCRCSLEMNYFNQT